LKELHFKTVFDTKRVSEISDSYFDNCDNYKLYWEETIFKFSTIGKLFNERYEVVVKLFIFLQYIVATPICKIGRYILSGFS